MPLPRLCRLLAAARRVQLGHVRLMLPHSPGETEAAADGGTTCLVFGDSGRIRLFTSTASVNRQHFSENPCCGAREMHAPAGCGGQMASVACAECGQAVTCMPTGLYSSLVMTAGSRHCGILPPALPPHHPVGLPGKGSEPATKGELAKQAGPLARGSPCAQELNGAFKVCMELVALVAFNCRRPGAHWCGACEQAGSSVQSTCGSRGWRPAAGGWQVARPCRCRWC